MASDGPAPTPDDKAKYDAAKKELMQALAKKRVIDKQLSQLEVQIYNLEATYLTETAVHGGGNIMQGFDGYLKNVPSGRRKYEISDADRIFSNSSVTHRKALDLAGEGEESTATAGDESRMPTPGLTTVVVPPAKQETSAAAQKKQRDREYQRKKRASMTAARRSAALSDDESVASTSSRRPTKRARIADDD